MAQTHARLATPEPPPPAPLLASAVGLARLPAVLLHATRTFWWWLRQIFGDAAYENYLRHEGARCPGAQTAPNAVSEQQFYLERLRRRHNGISRCC